MKRLLFVTGCLLRLSINLYSQLLTWTPDFAKDNDNITIVVDATKGNQGLNNYSNPNDIYVHVGLITSFSSNSGDWKHAPFAWGTTPSGAKATSLGNNKYSYTINNIRSFFAANPGEIIYKIAILFRNGSGAIKQTNTDGSDMFVPVYDNNVAVRFTVPFFQPKFIPEPEPLTKSAGDNITLTAISNKPAILNLYVNGTLIQTATAATTISASPTLTAGGNTTIIAEAIDGVVTKKDSFKFFISGGINVAPLPAGTRDGINYETGNTSAVLVLYAPGKNRVSVIGDFAGSNWTEQSQYLMNKTPDGNYWWLRITGLTPGTEYAFQYLVDGTLKIAEPYSEKILDPANDGFIATSTYPNLKAYPAGLTTGIVSLLQTNAPGYTWAVNGFSRPDKRNLIIYELLLRDFLSAHDWKTLRDTLNYLKTLGINAIEIMPFNEFEGNDSWGYNPDFYFAPDKYYGPKNTLKEFIDSCHSKGIAVLMDIALNHATGSCPLAALYWNNATGHPAANNPWFNVTATHPYSVFNDFNHESLATRYFTSRVVEFWLQEYKLDGFRFDLSKGFTQTNSCTTGNCDTGPEVNNWGNYDASRVAIWKRYYDTLQLKSPGCYAILEHFAANTEEIELSNYGMLLWGNDNYNFNEASMGYISTSNFEGGIYSVRGWTNPYLVTYMESHDEERLMYKNLQFGNSSGNYNTKDLNTALKRMEMCAIFFLNIPGPKMMWEFGEQGYDFSINRCSDGSINDNCRLTAKPVRWDYLQNSQRKELYNVYKSLLQLRANSWYKDVFTANNITLTRSLAGAFKWMIIRSAMDTSVLCAIGNFDVTGQASTFTFPIAGTWYDYLNGNTITATGSAQSISLQPGEFHLYLNRNVSNAILTPLVDINTGSKDLLIKVYPNPVQNNSVVEMYIPENGKVQVDLWNTIGQNVTTVYSGVLTKGKHELFFNNVAKRLSHGTYMMRVQSKNKINMVKLLF